MSTEAGLAISERGTLIIPIGRAALPFLKDEWGYAPLGLTLWPKAEHHFTVFGFSIGKHLGKARALPGFIDWVNARIAAHDWSWQLGQQCYHLRQPAPRALDTVVVRIEARIAEFFAVVEAEARARGARPELLEALAAPPPPHVTLYTSDREGKQGIGLNRVADLDAAIARGRAGDGSGLCAVEVPVGEVLG
ncbi:MAG: hypothetical protein IT370_33825 [Deltaproteobacteria bacterium]|nr:hypothetical protein [Deltaproteobacteria bacterium]